MTDVLRFHAPGPWLTRDLKECVLASDYDALAAAAGRVTCAMCGGEGTIPDWPPDNSVLDASCPDCAELRKLLEGER